MQFKRYQKESEHSYAFGVFATLELLDARPETAIAILLDSRGMRNEGVSKIEEICSRRRIGLEVNDKLVDRLSPKENTYAIGVFRKYYPDIKKNTNHIALVSPSDMGNLGTIIRTMLGFGVMDLALVRPAADMFDPRVVRASMGSLFRLSFAYFDSFEEYQRTFQRKLFLFMTNGKVRLQEAKFEQPFTLVFGNESAGLPEQFREIGTSVYVAHSDNIDSLNLPTAVGIALYEATKDEFSKEERMSK